MISVNPLKDVKRIVRWPTRSSGAEDNSFYASGSLWNAFFDRLKNQPDLPCLCGATLAQVESEARRLSAWLRQQGLCGAEMRLSWEPTRSWKELARLLAVVSTGGIAVLGKDVSSVPLQWPSDEELFGVQPEPSRAWAENLLHRSRRDDVLVVIFTLGTQTLPKGVRFTHGNLVETLLDYQEVFGGSGTRAFAVSSPAESEGLIQLLAAPVLGWEVGFLDTGEEILPALRKSGARLMILNQTLATRMREEIEREVFKIPEMSQLRFRGISGWLDLAEGWLLRLRLGSLERVVLVGFTPDEELRKLFWNMRIRLFVAYVLTELCGIATLREVHRQDQSELLGSALPRVSIRVTTEHEIEIKSQRLCAGYTQGHEFGEPESWESWWNTGDLGSIDAAGEIKLLSRKSDLISLTDGTYVTPEPIERLARRHPMLEDLVVVGEGRPYLVGLLFLDRRRVQEKAEAEGILFSGFAELIQHHKVERWIKGWVEELNAELPERCRIHAFDVILEEPKPEEWVRGALPRFRRAVLLEKFSKEIEHMYLPLDVRGGVQ